VSHIRNSVSILKNKLKNNLICKNNLFMLILYIFPEYNKKVIDHTDIIKCTSFQYLLLKLAKQNVKAKF